MYKLYRSMCFDIEIKLKKHNPAYLQASSTSSHSGWIPNRGFGHPCLTRGIPRSPIPINHGTVHNPISNSNQWKMNDPGDGFPDPNGILAGRQTHLGCIVKHFHMYIHLSILLKSLQQISHFRKLICLFMFVFQ